MSPGARAFLFSCLWGANNLPPFYLDRVCPGVYGVAASAPRASGAQIGRFGARKESGLSQSEGIVFEFAGILHFGSDDGGSALVAELPADLTDDLDDHGPAVFIRLHGWDKKGEHF